MITCDVNHLRGAVTVLGEEIPNGIAVLTRNRQGERPYVLRNGVFTSTTGAFIREDPEVPFGIEVRYDLDLTVDNRVIQRNYILTPDFLRGQKNWSSERNLELTTVQVSDTGLLPITSLLPDPSLLPSNTKSKVVGKVSPSSADVEPIMPTLMWHDEVGPGLVNYTFTLPGTAAVGDLIVLVHQNLPNMNGVLLPPSVPSPMTKLVEIPNEDISLSVWTGKLASGFATSYTVTFSAGSAGMASAMLVRDAGPVRVQSEKKEVDTRDSLRIDGKIIARPSLMLTAIAGTSSGAISPVVYSDPELDNWLQTSGDRLTVVATESMETNGNSTSVEVVFDPDRAVVTQAVGVLISVQSTSPIGNRSIITNKLGALPATGNPYVMTGRFMFQSPDIWLWQDVLEQGTWQDIADTKSSWAEVRSTTSTTLGDASYINLFVRITDSVDPDKEYIAPVEVISANVPKANRWVYFSFYFNTSVDIPSTAIVQLFHGSSAREYAVTWYFDMFAVTSIKGHESRFLYWFSGDSQLPNNAEDYYVNLHDWTNKSGDASITWAGEPGNSISLFTGPSKIGTSAYCTVIPDPGSTVCEPVYINDPISPPRGQWFSLMRIDALSYTARQSVLSIINRADLVAISQVRQWATGTLTVKTDTLIERKVALQIFETGRVLYLRNTQHEYPESEWYLAVGDITETRIHPNHRHPSRLWTIPFIRVDRPSGMIDTAVATTWQDIKDSGLSWGEIRDQNPNWLGLLS